MNSNMATIIYSVVMVHRPEAIARFYYKPELLPGEVDWATDWTSVPSLPQFAKMQPEAVLFGSTGMSMSWSPPVSDSCPP